MDITSILLIGAICIVIGFLLSQLVGSLGKKEEQPDPMQPERRALLKVWRDLEGEALVIELDGKEYRRSYNLSRVQNSQVQKLILELNDWLTSTPARQLEDPEPFTPEQPAPEGGPAEDATPRLSFNPVNMVVNALQADVQRSQLPEESIISQIDDILQEKLKDSSLEGEPIRLMEQPEMGMVVMVGLDRYEDVDEVPRDEIKEIIRSAVKEWEQRGLEEAD
jgi:hypothetical protein